MISKLMQHKQAGAFYTAIDATANPETLADDYRRFIAHGDYVSHCYALAIECHMRQLAQIGFARADIRQALGDVEAALDARPAAAHRKILKNGR